MQNNMIYKITALADKGKKFYSYTEITDREQANKHYNTLKSQAGLEVRLEVDIRITPNEKDIEFARQTLGI